MHGLDAYFCGIAWSGRTTPGKKNFKPSEITVFLSETDLAAGENDGMMCDTECVASVIVENLKKFTVYRGLVKNFTI